jgi:hypothetical protein
MNMNKSLVSDALMQIAQIKADFKAGKSFSNPDSGSSFESVLDNKINTDQFQTKQDNQIKQEQVSQDRSTDTPVQEKPKTDDRKTEDKGRIDEESIAASDESKETERTESKDETSSKENEENSSAQTEGKESDNQEEAHAAQAQANKDPKVAAQKKVALEKLADSKLKSENTAETKAGDHKEKVIHYTDSKGNSKVLRLQYSNDDIDKFGRKVSNTMENSRAANQSLQSSKTDAEMKSDVVLNSRQFDDDNTMKKLSQIQAADQQNVKTEQVKKGDGTKGKLVSIQDLLGGQSKVASASDQQTTMDSSGQGANLFQKNSSDIFKMEGLFSKENNRFGISGVGNSVPFETALKRIQSASGPQIRNVEARQQIVNQFLDAARIQLSKDNSTMNIRLKPDYLGEINMKLQIQSAGANKSSSLVGVIEVESHAVKEVLQGSFSQLKQTLEDENGLSVKKFEIIVKHEMPNQQQEQQQHAQHQDKKRSFRFIDSAYVEESSDSGSSQAWEPQERLVVNGYSWTA